MLFHVLGPLEVHGRDGEVHRPGHGKAATVLATLLLHPNAWVTSAKLIDATWHEAAAPASAEANLKTYVWQLRRALPADCAGRIESAPGRYRLRLDQGELDTHHVAEHAATARAAAGSGELAAAVTAFEAALGWWRGLPFEGVPVGRAADPLGELRTRLRDELAETQLALGRTGDAVHTLRALTEDDPLREAAWASLVRALHALGSRAEAVHAYRTARQALATELGVCPGRELAAAYRAVLGEPGVPRRELPCDVPLFTARAAELAAIPRTGGVVLVDGMPGIGKTALAVHVAHGLADAFPDGQFFVDLRGSTRPRTAADALGTLLRRAGVPDELVSDSADERAALWRCELARRRVLLVLDDAGGPGQVAPLLPAGTAGLVLVTTRNRDWHVDGAVRIGLGPLAEPDAAAMFRAATGAAVRTSTVVAALCGGIPAAVRDAAARLLTRPMWTPESLADELGAGPCRLLGCTRDGYRNALGTAFAPLSTAHRAALRALADLPGEFGLADAALVLGGTRETTRRTLEALVDASLLDAVSGARYRGHPLVGHYARCRECAPAAPAARVA